MAVNSILVIKPSSLGDVVHTLPAVAMLKRHWPQSWLAWLVNPEWAPLLAGNPHVDEVAIFPRGRFRGVAGWAKILPWARAMTERKADLVVDFQGLLRSALIARLCRGGEIAGLSDAREGARIFYDRVAPVAGVDHAVERYLRLAAELGAVRPPELEWPLPEGVPPRDFDAREPFTVLHPFSRGVGKSLTSEQVTACCAALSPRRVVVVGRSNERLAPAANVLDLLNQTSLPELIWLLRRAQCVISVDSGPIHIAAALGANLLAIHTWSDPAKVGPYSPHAWIWNGRTLLRASDLRETHAHRPCSSVSEACSFVVKQFGE